MVPTATAIAPIAVQNKPARAGYADKASFSSPLIAEIDFAYEPLSGYSQIFSSCQARHVAANFSNVILHQTQTGFQQLDTAF